jgi:hypothetical protein
METRREEEEEASLFQAAAEASLALLVRARSHRAALTLCCTALSRALPRRLPVSAGSPRPGSTISSLTAMGG